MTFPRKRDPQPHHQHVLWGVVFVCVASGLFTLLVRAMDTAFPRLVELSELYEHYADYDGRDVQVHALLHSDERVGIDLPMPGPSHYVMLVRFDDLKWDRSGGQLLDLLSNDNLAEAVLVGRFHGKSEQGALDIPAGHWRFVFDVIAILDAQPGRRQQTAHLLEDATQRQWCVFSDEKEFKREVQRRGSEEVATVEYVGPRVTRLQVATTGESADWIVYDEYEVSLAGALTALKRMANILPGDRSERLSYRIAAGRAALNDHTTYRLGTEEVFSPDEDWLPEIPIVTELNAFPFAPLITADVLSSLKGFRCAPWP